MCIDDTKPIYGSVYVQIFVCAWERKIMADDYRKDEMMMIMAMMGNEMMYENVILFVLLVNLPVRTTTTLFSYTVWQCQVNEQNFCAFLERK